MDLKSEKDVLEVFQFALKVEAIRAMDVLPSQFRRCMFLYGAYRDFYPQTWSPSHVSSRYIEFCVSGFVTWYLKNAKNNQEQGVDRFLLSLTQALETTHQKLTEKFKLSDIATDVLAQAYTVTEQSLKLWQSGTPS